MKNVKIISLVLCIIMLFSTTVSASNPFAMLDLEDGEAVAEYYDNLLEYLISNYKFDVTKEELLSAAVQRLLKENPEVLTTLGKGAIDALDKNSNFYTAEEYKNSIEDVSGIFYGVGVYVSADSKGIIFGECIENSPAMDAGIQVGDILIAVNGEDVTTYGLDKVTSLIKGPEGTPVSLTVLRNNIELTFDLVREKITINPITYHIIEGTDIGYMKISTFNANIPDEVEKAMTFFKFKNVSTIILDLRNNLGGILDSALFVASYFVPDNSLLVTQEYKDDFYNREYYSNETDCKFKAVILVNEYSASASEVVSSALRDYKTGVLVGKRTYGKGTVQETVPLKSNHYLWMTFSQYFTPSHTEIHLDGLKPDYVVTNTKEPFDMKTLTPYDIYRKLNVGDSGPDVKAVKERLKIMGYQLTVDDVYDQKTANVVAKFQEATGLFSYGVADLTTQVKINDTLASSEVEVDNQYERALEVAKKLK